MIENAIRGNRGRTIEQHGLAMGKLFSRFAKVAENNPLADRRQGFTAEQIASVNPDNPYIGFPYTKLMNSNAFIDQAAAIILTSAKKARELGVPEEKWVYLHGCADGLAKKSSGLSGASIGRVRGVSMEASIMK